eukprot:6490377-Amphidinium_carterae.3
MHAGISAEDRTALLQDFEYSKTYASFGLIAKLAFWQKLPWKLCALAHHLPSVKQRCAAEAIQEYDDSIARPAFHCVTQGATTNDHHCLSVELLDADGALRRDVVTVAEGGLMSEDLLAAVAKFRFVAVAERAVEAIHRDVKLTGKFQRLGPVRVSLAVRLKQMRSEFKTSTNLIAQLAEHFELARRPMVMASALGCDQHPQVLELFRRSTRVDVYEWLRTTAFAVHRCDLDTQFSKHDAARIEFVKFIYTDSTVSLHPATRTSNSLRFKVNSSQDNKLFIFNPIMT